MIKAQLEKTLVSPGRRFTLNVNLSCSEQRLLIYGPSGSGKSLLLQLLSGLQTPDNGYIHLAGRTLFDSEQKLDVPARQRKIAYLFQDYALFPHLTARQNIAFGLCRGLLNPSRRSITQSIEPWLERFSLHDVQQLYPHQLSGGQRQRTALARALVMRPAALLLDEPFSALDPALRQHMRQQLAELQTELAIPMLIISHDPDDLDYFSGSVIQLSDGLIKRDSQRLPT